MDFTESLTLEIPKLDYNVVESSTSSGGRGIVVSVAAIHEGLTANYNHYSAEELLNAVNSWTDPYPKPLLKNHDLNTDPLGRVIGAQMTKTGEGLPYIQLKIAVLDPVAIEMVKDQRYITGSVGGKVDSAICNICNADWAKATTSMDMPCKHQKGKVYKGKMAYLEMKGIGWREYSFVNAPADSKSQIEDISNEVELDNRIHVYSINMESEELLELHENGNTSLLESMKSKEAKPLYMNLKGAFLSAMSMNIMEKINEEKETMPQEDEDVLEITDKLTEDLAEASASDVDTDTEVKDDVVASDEDAEDEEDASEDSDAEDSADDAEDEEEEEEGDDEVGEEPVDEEKEDTELIAENEAFELRVEELESEIERLSEENAKLKTALKRSLVERVVDKKILLGMGKANERNSLIESHLDRSFASLADTMRDLATMKVQSKEIAEIKPTVIAAEEDSEQVVTESQEKKVEVDPKEVYVNFFTDVLMDRRKIK